MKSVLYILLRLICVGSAVILLTFFLLKAGKVDPTESYYRQQPMSTAQLPKAEVGRQIQQMREQLGLHLPVFFFRFTSAIIPRKWQAHWSPEKRKVIENWAISMQSFSQAQMLYEKVVQQLDATSSAVQAALWQKALGEPQFSAAAVHMRKALDNANPMQQLSIKPLLEPRKNWKTYLPRMHVYRQNQFTHWLWGSDDHKGLLQGNLGNSMTKHIPVWHIIGPKLRITMWLGFLALVVACGVGIPLGFWLGITKQKWLKQIGSALIYIGYAIPSFWLATILLFFLANPLFLKWFPTTGWWADMGMSASARMFDKVHHWVLPVFCLAFSSMVFIARLVQQSVEEVMASNYARAGRVRGEKGWPFIWGLVGRNALLPLITLVGVVLPGLVSGSVIMETIFSIPGMGQQLWLSASSADVPVVLAIVLWAASLSVLGYELADVLHRLADPRLRHRPGIEKRLL